MGVAVVGDHLRAPQTTGHNKSVKVNVGGKVAVDGEPVDGASVLARSNLAADPPRSKNMNIGTASSKVLERNCQLNFFKAGSAK